LSEDITVTLKLSLAEAMTAKNLVDELIDLNAFNDLPFESYVVLEKLSKAIHILDERKVTNPGKLKSQYCQTCGHSSWDHSGGNGGVCCAESCRCWSFVK
jgi:hypothetical protein